MSDLASLLKLPLSSGDLIPRTAKVWGWELHGYHFALLPSAVYNCAMIVLAAHRLLRTWQYGEIAHQEACPLLDDLRSHCDRGGDQLGELEKAGFPLATSPSYAALGITAPSATHVAYRLGWRDLEEYIGRDGTPRPPIDMPELVGWIPDLVRDHNTELDGLAVAMWSELRAFKPEGSCTHKKEVDKPPLPWPAEDLERLQPQTKRLLEAVWPQRRVSLRDVWSDIFQDEYDSCQGRRKSRVRSEVSRANGFLLQHGASISFSLPNDELTFDG